MVEAVVAASVMSSRVLFVMTRAGGGRGDVAGGAVSPAVMVAVEPRRRERGMGSSVEGRRAGTEAWGCHQHDWSAASVESGSGESAVMVAAVEPVHGQRSRIGRCARNECDRYGG